MSVRPGTVFLVAAGLLAAACGASPEGVPEGAFDGDLSASPLRMEGPIGVNGLDPVDFWKPENQQALRALGAGPLLGGDGALVATPLLNTEGGRAVLSYALRCGLAEGTSAEAAGGQSFEGEIGLAPAWALRGLNTSEQRWTTACLLSHLNGVGAHVPIMLQGSHPALDPIPGLDITDYNIADATTFGNLFTSSPKAYVCADVGLNLACGVGLSTHTLTRLCGLSPTCGITMLGLCALSCTYSSGDDPACGPLLGPVYNEAISTRLEETAFLSLYPVCNLL